MNLPDLAPLNSTQSTYITFTKALVDMDAAISNKREWYFSRAVAINLPNWQSGSFFTDLTSIGITSLHPGTIIPKVIQYYMENILRFDISLNQRITELAFWKALKYMGLSSTDISNLVTFSNTINISNFINTDNNNGWSEIVVQVPNRSAILVPKWMQSPIPTIIQGEGTDTALYDNGDRQYLFGTDDMYVLDFDNFTYDTVQESSFNFNALLLYYNDNGIDKLHGINFILPPENKVMYYELPRLEQKTNVVSSIGYQFKFNMKSCNNEATRLQVYELQEHSHWNVFSDTLGKLNSFLELKMREGSI